MANIYSITGAGSDIGKDIISYLSVKESDLHLYSTQTNPYPLRNNLIYNKILNYENIKLPQNSNKLLVCNGNFQLGKFELESTNSISELVNANFTVVLQIINQYLKDTAGVKKRDIYILGSTAAYDLGPYVSTYAASKFALRGFVTSINKEFFNSNTRFTLISFGTVNNEMGLKVPNQIKSTLLNSREIGEQITEIMENKFDSFQPEIVVRRRFTQSHQI
jgi:short-subunit dehydrogenase